MRDRLHIPNVAHIAVLAGNGMGDLIFALPALEALRAAYRRAEIVLLGRSWHQGLLQGRRSAVDRVAVLPPRLLGTDPEEHAAAMLDDPALVALRAGPWDVAIQLHGGGRSSNPLVASLGARLTAGCRSPDAPSLDRSIPYRYWQHEILRHLEVASLVGAAGCRLEPRLAVTQRDRRAIRQVLGDPPRAPLRATTVLHPGAGDPRRRWPARAFARLGDVLETHGQRVVVVGAESESEVAGEVVESMTGQAVDLSGQLDLSALVGLLAEASLFVGNDSGPLHLAGAVGAPRLGIFWCGNLINAGPFFRSRAEALISWTLACPECGLDCTRASCEHRPSFVADVPFDRVLEASLALLERTGRAAAQPVPPHASRAHRLSTPAC